MIKKVVTKVERKLKKVKEKFSAVIAAFTFLFVYITRPIPVYAAYLKLLNNLKTMLLAIAAVVGVITVVYGIYRLADSLQKMDQQGERSAAFTIAGGSLLAFGSAVLTALGF